MISQIKIEKDYFSIWIFIEFSNGTTFLVILFLCKETQFLLAKQFLKNGYDSLIIEI